MCLCQFNIKDDSNIPTKKMKMIENDSSEEDSTNSMYSIYVNVVPTYFSNLLILFSINLKS